MAHYAVPGVALALIAESEIALEAAYGVKETGRDDPVTAATRFQACSISKPVAVLGMLRLVEQGLLDLDADVNDVLTSWRVPPNASWQPRVTLRQIASHSAGLTVGGFPGYARGAPLPTLTEILTGTPPANTAGIRVDTLPGVEFRYAGGGTTVLQQVLEDVTGRPFAELMRELVLEPLGMSAAATRSRSPTSCTTRRRPRTGRTATPVEGGWHVYPELAAAGLWTTPGDLARFAIAVQRAAAAAPGALLGPALDASRCSRAMRVPDSRLGGLDSVGLGLFLAPRCRVVRAQRRQRGLQVPPDRAPRGRLRPRGDDERRPRSRPRRGDPRRRRGGDGLAGLGGVRAGRGRGPVRRLDALTGATSSGPARRSRSRGTATSWQSPRSASRRSGSCGSRRATSAPSPSRRPRVRRGELFLRQNDGELRCRRVGLSYT